MRKLFFLFLISMFLQNNFLKGNIFEAIQVGNLEWVKDCIESGEAEDEWNRRMVPLHQAVIHNFYEAVVALIETGVAINPIDEDWCTPLHYATMKPDREKISIYLIEKGADVMAGDKIGFTPLHNIAAKKGSAALCLRLLKRGSNPNSPSSGGSTPRDLTKEKEIEKLFEEWEEKHKQEK